MSARRRHDAIAAYRAALAAVEAGPLVERFLVGPTSPIAEIPRLEVAALGKAATGMLTAAAKVLGDRLVGGVLVAPSGSSPPSVRGVQCLVGGHPLPDEGSEAAGFFLVKLAEQCARREAALLVLLSGGASALAVAPPPDISVDDLRRTTRLLLRAGLPIEELNAVRIRLDRLKGGGLAALARPAPVVALVLSDVVGDRLDLVGSGPTVPPPPDAVGDLRTLLRARNAWNDLPPGVRRRLVDEPREPTPADRAARVETHLIGNLERALDAAETELERRGYQCSRAPEPILGEARERGAELARWGLERLRQGPPGKAARIAGGETTVTVRGAGRGGRNQELALAAALTLGSQPGITLASLATDGVDGPTDAAGAVVDANTIERADARRLDLERALRQNDSHTVLAAVDALVQPGPTGTNVGDLQLVLLDV